MTTTQKPPLFYPEDKIAVSFSIVILAIQVYYYATGFLKNIADLITPLIFFTVLLGLIFFQRNSTSKILKFIRSFIHVIYYGIIFSAFQTFVHKMNPTDYDTMLLRWDMAVFGFDITRWFEPYISKGLTEVLTISYFSYYILFSLTFIMIYFMKKENSFLFARNYLLAIVIGWYGALIFYIALPSAGPDIAFPEHYTVPLQGLSPLTNTFLENLAKYLKESNIRNTFPSMHFGIILMANYFAFIYRRKYFWFCTLPLGILLAVATVYLRQHYLIDLVGSIPIAVISIYTALWINRRNSY